MQAFCATTQPLVPVAVREKNGCDGERLIGDAFSGDSLWRKISIDTAYILGEPILLRVSTGAHG